MAGALAVSGLQNVEATFLYREFEVLHVFEVMFKDRADFHQLFVRCGHFFCQIANRMRRPHTGDDIFALRVNQIFTIEHLLAGSRIARERDSRRAGFAHISEHHRLDVDRRAPVVRNPVFPSINDGAIIHPRAENCADCSPKLFAWILWKQFSGPLLDQRFKPLHELLQIGDR